MLDLILVERIKNGNEIKISLVDGQTIAVKPGATYSVFDKATMQPPAGLKLTRKGDALTIEIEEEVVARLEDFYGEGSDAVYSVDGSSSEAMIISGAAEGTAGEASEGIVWEATTETTQNTGLLLGAGALGVGAIAALASSGDNGPAPATGGDDDDTGPATFTMTMNAVAGPLQSTATVEVYDTDGNLLTTTDHDFSSGPFVFTVDTGYVGPFLVKVIDANGPDGDYVDETTGNLVSLGTEM